ncbi:MAG: ATP-dependent DNA helicase [Spongiibacteraceae bacterium]
MLDSSLNASILAANGELEALWPAFEPRLGQQQMAELIRSAIISAEPLVIEAPSGSGKTVAYLIPLLTQTRRAIISTASRYLQQQLYRHDIPKLQTLLGSEKTVAVLQGRSHYLCPYYVDKNLHSDSGISSKHRQQLMALSRRFNRAASGELEVLAPDISSTLRQLATSSSDDCLGKACPQFIRCPLMLSRQRALRADIVVVNHSLLFSNQVIKREGEDLLANCGVVVVDEAHRIADFAQGLVGERMSSYTLKRFCHDCIKTIVALAPEQRSLLEFIKRLQQAMDTLTESVSVLAEYQREQHIGIIQQLIRALQTLARHLDAQKERDQNLMELAIRNHLLLERLQGMVASADLCLVQTQAKSFILQTVPVYLTPFIRELLAAASDPQQPCSWVFTSATLSIAKRPDRFLNLLGLDKHRFKRVGSELSFQRQAKLYTPSIPVDPDHLDYNDYFITHLLPLLNLVEGRVLVLFSSHRSLSQAAEALAAQSDLPQFVQAPVAGEGEIDNYRLIAAFKAETKGVLLGTGSFWEGLDLAGAALSAVVIDKLPFAPPTDPLQQLRAEQLNRFGVDHFQHSILPEAVIRFQQGCGRLLRRLSDRGVIMIADPRLHKKDYGAVFIESLPAMERVNSIAELKPFFTSEIE